MANDLLGLLSGGGASNPLINIGAGLLSVAGPSLQPRSIGEGLSLGLDRAQQANLLQMKNQALREEMQQKARQREARQTLLDRLSGPTQEVGQGQGALLPEAVPNMQSPEMMGLLMQAFPETAGALLSQQFAGNEIAQKIRNAEEALGRPLTEAQRMEVAGVEQSPEQRKAEFLESRGIAITPEIARELVSAGGTTVNVGGDSPLDEPIPISSIDDVRMPDGNPVPIGTTFRQAREAGAQVLSTDEQKALSNAESAKAILNELEQLATGEEGIFSTVEPGFLNRASAAFDFALQSLSQEDPKVSRFRDLSEGAISKFVRTLGERGALAEGDVSRALGLLPRIFPLPDTGEVARAKIQDLRTIIRKGVRNLNKGDTEPEPEGGGDALDLGDGVKLEIIQ